MTSCLVLLDVDISELFLSFRLRWWYMTRDSASILIKCSRRFERFNKNGSRTSFRKFHESVSPAFSGRFSLPSSSSGITRANERDAADAPKWPSNLASSLATFHADEYSF